MSDNAGDADTIHGPTMKPTGGHAGVMSTGWDGNYSVNYPGKVNARVVDHIHYGEEDMDCPGCGGMGC